MSEYIIIFQVRSLNVNIEFQKVPRFQTYILEVELIWIEVDLTWRWFKLCQEQHIVSWMKSGLLQIVEMISRYEANVRYYYYSLISQIEIGSKFSKPWGRSLQGLTTNRLLCTLISCVLFRYSLISVMGTTRPSIDGTTQNFGISLNELRS